MPSFNWLHLTDLHLGMSGQTHLWPNIRDVFFKDLTKLHKQCGPWDAVLFTGDLVQRGTIEEFAKLDELLDQLWTHLNSLGSYPVLLAVPGNHDLVRPSAKKSAVRMLSRWEEEHEIHEELWEDPESEYREVINEAFKNYQKWWQRSPLKDTLEIQPGILPGDFSVTWLENGLSIGIAGLNTTFLQLDGGDYYQKLAWDARQFHNVCDGDGAGWSQNHHACLLLTHQPPEWLNKISKQQVYSEINPAGRFAAHLFGHMHDNVIRSSNQGGGEVVRHWQGSSLFGLEYLGSDKKIERNHGYSAGCIEIINSKGFIRHWPRKAIRDDVNGWRFEADQSSILDTDNGTMREAFKLLKPWLPCKNTNLRDQKEQLSLIKKADLNSKARYKENFLNNYQTAVLRECDIIRLSGLPEGDKNLVMQTILLRQLYVPLRMTIEVNCENELDELEGFEEKREKQRLINAGRNYHITQSKELLPVAEHLAEGKRLVILGDPGSGKTTLLRWLATACILKLRKDPDLNRVPDIDSLGNEVWLPLVIRCRELDVNNLRTCTFDEILNQTLRKAELEVGSLEIKLIKDELLAGRLILLIDGLDEITDPSLRTNFCHQLERVAAAYPKAPMLVTSRVVGYREMRYRIGEGFEHGLLAELSKNDKDDFIKRWCAVTETKQQRSRSQAELIEAVHISDRIERLTGNPMLLTTLALVKRKVGKLPTRRSELYREAVDVLLNWRSELDTPLDKYEALPQLEYIAYEMCHRGIQQLRRDELIDLLENVRRDYPNIRVINKRNPEQFLALLEARTGLIVEVGEKLHHGQTQPVYEFRHLTFQEYLASLALVQGHFPEYDKSSSLAQRISPLAGQMNSAKNRFKELEVSENWRETLRLCMAICNDEVVDEALMAILMPVAGEDVEQIKRPRAILAFLCLADEPNVSEMVGLEVIKSFLDIVKENRIFRHAITNKAALELANSYWRIPLIDALVHRYSQLDFTKPEGNSYGQLIGRISVIGLPTTGSEFNTWMEKQVTHLQGSVSESIKAAFSIINIMNKIDELFELPAGLVEALLGLLNKSNSQAHVSALCLKGLSNGELMWTQDSKNLDSLIDYLEHPSAVAGVLEQILQIIYILPSQHALSSCLKLTKHENARVRSSAVDALGAIKDDRAVETLLEMIKDTDNTVSYSVVRALGAIKALVSIEPLLKLLNGYGRSQVIAVQALGLIGNDRALEPLIEQLKNESRKVRHTVIQALGLLGNDRAVEPLIELFKVEDETGKLSVINSLGSIKMAKTKAYLMGLLKDESSIIRETSLGALVNNYDEEYDQFLLSRDLDGLEPWLDPKEPIDIRYTATSHYIGLTIEEITIRLQKLAKQYDLVLLEN